MVAALAISLSLITRWAIALGYIILFIFPYFQPDRTVWLGSRLFCMAVSQFNCCCIQIHFRKGNWIVVVYSREFLIAVAV